MLMALMMILQAATPTVGITLAPGDSMIIRPVDDDQIVIVTDHAAAEQHPGPGEVRVDFRVTNGQSFLTLQNNAPALLDYRAATVRGSSKANPSSVCRVMGDDKMGVEHWPYEIRTIALFGFHRTTDSEIVCR